MKENMWISMRNQMRPKLGEILELGFVKDDGTTGVVEGVLTNEGMKALKEIPFNKFFIITEWREKENDC